MPSCAHGAAPMPSQTMRAAVPRETRSRDRPGVAFTLTHSRHNGCRAGGMQGMENAVPHPQGPTVSGAQQDRRLSLYTSVPSALSPAGSACPPVLGLFAIPATLADGRAPTLERTGTPRTHPPLSSACPGASVCAWDAPDRPLRHTFTLQQAQNACQPPSDDGLAKVILCMVSTAPTRRQRTKYSCWRRLRSGHTSGISGRQPR
jgi:hypothetical protein